MQKNYLADKVFTGDEWITGAVVVTENGTIKELVQRTKTNSASGLVDLQGSILIPAFIDLQIYGANKKLFAVHPTVDALADLYNYCKDGGAVLFQPTLATNTMEVFFRGIDTIRKYWGEGGKGVIGLHLEGPWLNPEKKGAHPKKLIHSPTLDEVKELLEYGRGVITMITIAPEVCSKEVIHLIQSYGVIISAGHSNANYLQAMAALDEGISAITHLYNAMSALQHREPGLVGAAFTHSSAMASIIPDGHHVNYAAIKIAVQVMQQRLFVITDAVTETTEGSYHHHLENDKYTAHGILSGSSLTMHRAFLNLINHVMVSPELAIKMCSLYPAQVMGLAGKYGKIAPGYAAQFLVLDHKLNLKEVVTS